MLPDQNRFILFASMIKSSLKCSLILVKCLVKLAHEKSVVRRTDRPDMTIAIDWDVKHQIKQKHCFRTKDIGGITVNMHPKKNKGCENLVCRCCVLHIQGSHRLEKYLNLKDFIEMSLKIRYALKSTGKSFKGLEKSLNSSIICRT